MRLFIFFGCKVMKQFAYFQIFLAINLQLSNILYKFAS